MPDDLTAANAAGDAPRETASDNATDHNANQGSETGEPTKKKRRRRRRRKPAGEGAEATTQTESSSEAGEAGESSDEPRSSDGDDAPKKKRRRRRSGDGDDRGERRDGRGSGRGDRDGSRREGRGGRDGGRERPAPGDTVNIDLDDAPVDTSGSGLGDVDLDSDVFDQSILFKDMGLRPEVVQGLEENGYTKPTSIQAKLIPAALTGKDVLGQARTGTGKTASFGVPLLHMCTPGDSFQALVLAPTRELAVQIAQEIKRLGKHTGLTVCPVYGGSKMNQQIDALEAGPEIVVGTPGRVQDMIERGHLRAERIKFALLDEVDRMFDIGFRDDIRRILRLCPPERQTIFVSATISPEIEDLARRHMKDPEKIVTSSGSLTVSLVEQFHVSVDGWDKRRLLRHILKHEEPALTLVFCRLKRTVDEMARYLTDKGIESFAIHGDLPQSKRERIVKQLKAGKLEVLVASDLAARGLDVGGISHVINYDLPDDPEVYVHRIGRTARIGRKGIAWSFVTQEDGPILTEIEVLIDKEIPHKVFEDFERRPKPDGWKPPSRGGRPVHVVENIPDKPKNRFAELDPDALKEQVDASKFPGGVIPSKMPPKRMNGRVRTNRR